MWIVLLVLAVIIIGGGFCLIVADIEKQHDARIEHEHQTRRGIADAYIQGAEERIRQREMEEGDG